MVLIFYTRHKLLFVCTYKSNIEKLFVSFVIKITGFLDKQMIATTESIYNTKKLGRRFFQSDPCFNKIS